MNLKENNNIEEIIKYLNDILETDKNCISKEILRRAELRYPQHFVLDDDNPHPFDTNYDSREAYYDGMKLAYQDILEKLFKKKKL